ncbi:hypothetical protein BC939DRAFT_436681 [Gamsiella multidivaricata]|uniref:uncharacterized protein n=1 Tax=Gamsiella multidivaricata TaxID=101098 RepID=UPI002220678C|nr:uncharacterized protein BC939DRAFT_436681 [Gamsiella multidivaricata]KAI7831812.1 hypothetical protein BC939DRAFT_436681 [Gamsiella multidivaricata]
MAPYLGSVYSTLVSFDWMQSASPQQESVSRVLSPAEEMVRPCPMFSTIICLRRSAHEQGSRVE